MATVHEQVRRSFIVTLILIFGAALALLMLTGCADGISNPIAPSAQSAGTLTGTVTSPESSGSSSPSLTCDDISVEIYIVVPFPPVVMADVRAAHGRIGQVEVELVVMDEWGVPFYTTGWESLDSGQAITLQFPMAPRGRAAVRCHDASGNRDITKQSEFSGQGVL